MKKLISERDMTPPPPKTFKRKARHESEAERVLAIHLRELGLAFAQQVPVTAHRRWKWDFLLVDYRIAIEVDGFFKGRHGAGWGSDYEKQNHGTVNGTQVLRFTSTDVKNGKAKAFLAELFERKS